MVGILEVGVFVIYCLWFGGLVCYVGGLCCLCVNPGEGDYLTGWGWVGWFGDM